MKGINLHTPHFSMPQVGRRPPDAAHDHQHHHRPAFRTMKRIEGGFDILIVALVVILALAMIYGLVTATGHPAYFDRWPG